MKYFSSSIRIAVIIFCIVLTGQWLFANSFYGANIRKVYIGSAPRDIDVSKSDPNVIYVTSVGLYKSEDAGDSYKPINIANLGVGMYELEICPADPAILYGLANNYIMEQFIYVSKDSGKTWQRRSDGTIGLIPFIRASPNPPYPVYSNPDYFSVSYDNCETWIPIDTTFIWPSCIDFVEGNDSTIYVGDYRHGILVSTDNGTTWDSLGLADYRADKLVAVNPENLNVIYATVEGYGLFKTADGGANWQNLNGKVSAKYFTRLLVNRLNPDQVFVATLKSGLFISNSAGSSWEHLGPANAYVAALAFNEQEGRLFFSVLYEPYVYIVDVDSIFASVENRSRGAPNDFQLLQNYPNPFNAETWIRYKLLRQEKVTIAIYNVFGRKVRTLIKGDQLPGTHRVKWDGRDDWGKEVSSGVYVYQLRAGQKSLTRKLLLVR